MTIQAAAVCCAPWLSMRTLPVAKSVTTHESSPIPAFAPVEICVSRMVATILACSPVFKVATAVTSTLSWFPGDGVNTQFAALIGARKLRVF